MAELEEQVAEIVTDAVERIVRLLGRDDIQVPDAGAVAAEAPRPARPKLGPTSTNMDGSTDQILRNFLGLDR